MSYIGKEPQVGAYNMLDSLTASATADYSLTLDSTAFVPESANHLLVSLNGVIQKAGSSFTVSGSTLSFSSALTSSDSIDFVLALGNVLDIGTPSDSTVSLSKLTATGTKDSTTFLRGDNTFATVSAGKIGQIISAESTTETNIASTTHADTNLSATITPTATSSKILVSISQIAATDRDSNLAWIKYKVLRGSTELFGHSKIFWVEAGSVSAVKNGGFISLQFVDEPSSTSALTYKTQGAISDTANNGTARFQQASAKSFIQLMEILA